MSMNTTTIDIAKLALAHEAGEIYANNLKPGLIFLGAGPAAQAAGYLKNSPEYRMFLAGALDLMQRWIIQTGADSRIITAVIR